jgi:Zn-dependent peptidase ImmA (M78 family)
MKSVLIFGKKIPVIYKKDLFKNHGAFGLYDLEKDIIEIDSDMPDQVKFETLVHEMGHALFKRTGLAFDEAITKHEEHLVEKFSIMFSENFFNKMSKKIFKSNKTK